MNWTTPFAEINLHAGGNDVICKPAFVFFKYSHFGRKSSCIFTQVAKNDGIPGKVCKGVIILQAVDFPDIFRWTEKETESQ